jgi:hypothetical protein
LANRGPEPAAIRVLPTIWFRNRWTWDDSSRRGRLEARPPVQGCAVIAAETLRYGRRWLYAEGEPALLFTENETNAMRLFGIAGPLYAKDGIDEAIVQGRSDAVNPARVGTKAAADYALTVQPAEPSASPALSRRAVPRTSPRRPPFADFDDTMTARQGEADEFYATINLRSGRHARAVMRQSLAGLLWSSSTTTTS